MIHVLNAPQKLCDALRGACPEDLDCSCPHFDGPLGRYLFLALALNVPAAYCAASALQNQETFNCSSQGVPTLCRVDLALAIINVAYAWHVKQKLEQMQAESSLQEPLDSAAVRPRFKALRDSVRQLALYDVLTCVYILAYCFCLVWNTMGSTWLQSCPLSSNMPSEMVSLELSFFFLSLIYVLATVCYVNCVDFVEGVRAPRSLRDVDRMVDRAANLADTVRTKVLPLLSKASGRSNRAGGNAPAAASVPSMPVPSAPPLASIPAGTEGPDSRQAVAGAV